jgi:hypothetical protein
MLLPQAVTPQEANVSSPSTERKNSGNVLFDRIGNTKNILITVAAIRDEKKKVVEVF